MELQTGIPADAPSATVAASTSADPAWLWRIITDPSHPVGVSPELVAAEWIDGGPALGAHFRGDNQRGDRRWSTTCTVTSCEEGRRFGWTVNALHEPVSTWTYELDTSEAGTRISYTCRLGPGPSCLTAARAHRPDRAEELTAGRLASLREAMEATLDHVVARAEGAPTAPPT